jgi:hypothetical protein
MVGFASGCSLGSAATHGARPVAPPMRVTIYRGGGIGFVYPDAWRYRVRNPGVTGTIATGIVDLATQPFPVGHLKPGGVFVAWTADYETSGAHSPSPGSRVEVTTPGLCSRIGATETVAAQVVTRTYATYTVRACIRGPGLAAGERAVRAMVASAKDMSTATALLTFRGGDVSFRYPAAWRHHRPGVLSHLDSGIVDLSTQRLRNPCRSNGHGHVCKWPLQRLRPGGVLVTWSHADEQSSEPSLVPRSSVAITQRGVCRAIGGDATLTARVVTRRRRPFFVIACMRGTDMPADLGEIRAMLASAR